MQGFGSPALITLTGLFAVSAGQFRSGSLDRLRALIASGAVRSPRRGIAPLVGAVAPASGFIPNTPIVATLLPAVESGCHRRGVAPSRVLLPLSFATVLGGTISLPGTSTNLLAVRRGNEVLRELLGRVVLQAGDVLLLQAPLDAIRGLQASNDLVLLDELEKDPPTTNRKGVSVLVAALVILLPLLKWLNLLAAVLLAVAVMVATGCLRPGELQRAIRWDVILLLGSLSCFSAAMQKTGLAQALATDLLHAACGAGPPMPCCWCCSRWGSCSPKCSATAQRWCC